MTRPRDLSSEEAKLWRRVAKTTKAYKASLLQVSAPMADIDMAAVSLTISQPELPHVALQRARLAKLQQKPVLPPPKSLEPTAKIADASGHRKVRRGKLTIDARIDLHGMRQIEAQTALAGIIIRTRTNNGRCILVVTGKGRPVDPGEDFITPQPGVIRRRLPEWLSGVDIREHVSGFAPANAKDGGSGAFYVLLKSNPKKV